MEGARDRADRYSVLDGCREVRAMLTVALAATPATLAGQVRARVLREAVIAVAP